MEYKVTKVVEEIDVLSVSQQEYDRLNEFYREIITKRFPRLARDNQIYDVRRIVMTDDLSRIEVVVAVDGHEPDRIRTPQTENN